MPTGISQQEYKEWCGTMYKSIEAITENGTKKR